jgi:polyhydroxyalkanoate synthesis regulator phasin
MLEHVKKGVLAALGAVVFTEEKLEEVIRDLVRGGKLTRDQGAQVLQELVARGEKTQGDLGKLTADVAQKIAKWQPVMRGEFDELRARVEALEARVGRASCADEPSCGYPPPNV